MLMMFLKHSTLIVKFMVLRSGVLHLALWWGHDRHTLNNALHVHLRKNLSTPIYIEEKLNE